MVLKLPLIQSKFKLLLDFFVYRNNYGRFTGKKTFVQYRKERGGGGFSPQGTMNTPTFYDLKFWNVLEHLAIYKSKNKLDYKFPRFLMYHIVQKKTYFIE